MAFDKSNIGKNCYINLSQEVSTEDSALGTIIGYYNDNAEEYYFVSIIPDGKVIKVYDSDEVNIIEESSSSVTPESVVNATSQMDAQQKEDTKSNLSVIDCNSENIVIATQQMTPAQAARTRQNIGAVESVIYAESKTIKVGDNTLGSATLGTGWTESDGSYIHESGNTEELTINTSLSEDDVAILDFDTSFTTGEFITVGIGTAYKSLVYNASSHIRVPLKAIGNTTLHIVPLSTFNGSIYNLTLRKIQDSGTEIALEYKDVLTVNHDSTYGFWNTFLGYNTADDAVGSTRCVAIGYNALRDLQGGHRNIGIGTFAMSQLIGGERNVSIGADSMLGVKGGTSNISIGDGALYNGTAPEGNVSIGSHANYGNASKSPKGNVAIGAEAGFYNEGDNNVFLGKQAGYRNRTGSYNIMIGGQAFGSNGGNGNTLIGYNQATTTPLTGAIGLGSGAVPTKNHQMMLGSNVITEVVLCGDKKLIFNNDGTVTWETLTQGT